MAGCRGHASYRLYEHMRRRGPCIAQMANRKVQVVLYAETGNLQTALLGDTIKSLTDVLVCDVPSEVSTWCMRHLQSQEIAQRFPDSLLIDFKQQYKRGSTSLPVYLFGGQDTEHVGSIRVEVS